MLGIFGEPHEEIAPNEPNNLRGSIGEFDDPGKIWDDGTGNPKKSPRKIPMYRARTQTGGALLK